MKGRALAAACAALLIGACAGSRPPESRWFRHAAFAPLEYETGGAPAPPKD